MGLDMYIHRISKPKRLPKKITDKWLYGHNCMVIDEEDLDAPGYLEIKPFGTKRQILEKQTKYDRIAEDYNMDKSYIKCSGITPTQILFSDSKKTIVIDESLVNDKYTTTIEKMAYIFKTELVFYWRKEYKLQEYIYDLLDRPIENCGYYKLSKSEIIKIVDYCLEHQNEETYEMSSWEAHTGELYPTETKNGALFYEEWY